MRSEQWIRTQKRRVRKKYRKGGIGNMYFSPKESRDFRHGKYWGGDLVKAVENITVGVNEALKLISEISKEASE